MHTRHLKIYFVFITSVLLLIFSAGIIFAINNWNEGYRINNAATVDVSNGNVAGSASTGVCNRVVNNSGQNIFVPTKTQAEWDAFASHLPTNVTFGSCCTSHSYSQCSGGNRMWYNSCGVQEDQRQACSCGCTGDVCNTCATYFWKNIGGALRASCSSLPSALVCDAAHLNSTINVLGAESTPSLGVSIPAGTNVCSLGGAPPPVGVFRCVFE